ncbi:hypothetical protein EI94DRAFT_1594796 [Lactarius quietus]|nr:hypothetical protein EI94DRAFT_1594796 [Lactarius quietus]
MVTDESYDDQEAHQRNPIALAHVVVRAIWGSGLRREAFNKTINIGDEKFWWGNDEYNRPIQLGKLQLLRDVHTWWDSVYKMLQRLRMLHPAVDNFLALHNNSDLSLYKISPREWSKLEEIEFVLSRPHNIFHLLSTETVPALLRTLPTFEVFMSSWEKVSSKEPHFASLIKPGLEHAHKYYSRMDRTQSYIIALSTCQPIVST